MNILHPINFFRDFRNDFPIQLKRPSINKIYNIAISALPLITIHQPFAKALTPVLNCLRTITTFSQLVQSLNKGQINRLAIAYHLLQSCLSVSVVALSIFNPIYGIVGSSLSDMISNAKECILNLKEGKYKESMEALTRLILSSLFLGIICYGSIELTVTMLVLQIVSGCYESINHFKKGEIIEGVLKSLTTGIYVKKAIPQVKVLQWKWEYEPKMEAVLRQDERGFVYLDILDDDLKSLYQKLGDKDADLPPYFGPGRAGAHVSVIAVSEMAEAGKVTISELGKKFEFRISHTESLKPLDFKGVDQVSFLALACPEMESLRAKYGFTPRMNGHDFHLTYALKYET